MIYFLGWAGVACNTLGAVISLWMLAQCWGDARWLVRSGITGSRQAIAQFSLEDEAGRLLVQITLIVIRVPSLVMAPQRFSVAVDSLWGLAALSTAGMFLITIVMVFKSFRSWQMRRKVLADGERR